MYHADGLQPGKLVAVGTRRAIDHDGAGIEIRRLVVWEGRGRRDGTEQHVMVAEEVCPDRLEPQPLLLCESVLPDPLRDVAGPTYRGSSVTRRCRVRPLQERLKGLVREPSSHSTLNQTLRHVVRMGKRDG